MTNEEAISIQEKATTLNIKLRVVQRKKLDDWCVEIESSMHSSYNNAKVHLFKICKGVIFKEALEEEVDDV